MKAADLARELLYPLRSPTVLLAVLAFGFAFTIAIVLMRLGPVLAVVGAALALVVATALFRYGMAVLEARANSRLPAVADIDIFSIFDRLWRVFPLVLLLPAAWLGIRVDAAFGGTAALGVVIVFLVVYPASIAVLAITHSPLQSLNPAALLRMMTACGPAYVFIPVLLSLMVAASGLASIAGLPLVPGVLLDTYTAFLLFTLTGAVAGSAGVATDLDIGTPAEPSVSGQLAATRTARRKIADHAYGFISRGNREGGFRHIRDAIARDPDPDDAVGWYFNEMMRWESKDAALFFAQACLSHYLHHDMETEALKLMSICTHASPRWRPQAADLDPAIELAERHARDDLLASLRG